MKCYKVIKGDNRSIISNGDATVHYFNGEYVKAPKYLAEQSYHLTAFRTFKDAEEVAKYYFWNEVENAVIWEASGKGKIETLPLIGRRASVDYKGELVQPIGGLHDWPENTLMFKELKLIKIAQRLS